MDLIKFYKNIVESAHKEPPAVVWEEIQNELDIEAVWNNLEKELPSRNRERTLFIMAAAASLLVLIGVGILFWAAPRIDGAREMLAGYGQEFDLHPGHIQPEGGTIQPLHPAVLNFPEIRENSISETPSGAETVVPSLRDPGITNLQNPEKPGLISRSENIKDAGLHEISITHGQNGSISADDRSGKRFALSGSGYYAGLTGHVSNTWLVNNKTLQGLKSDDLTASLPSFGYNIGLIAGKSINRNLDLQAEGYIVSLTRQSYNEYLNGHYINNMMQFSYARIALSGRWFFIDHNNHALLFGAYTGFLKNARQVLNGQSVSLNDEYHATDYGIIAGYEYFHPLGNNLLLGTGFQTKIGLNNIFAGNEIIPDYLNNTRNASLNLIISLRYNLN